MALALWGMLGLLVLAGSALAIFVATPLHIRISGRSGPDKTLTAELSTLWGRSPRIRVNLLNMADRRQPPRRAKQPQRRKDKHRKGRPMAMPAHAVRAFIDFGAAELSRIHIDRLRGHAIFGFSDPAMTGQVFGMLTPFVYGLPSDRADLALAPDFSGPRFEGDGDAHLHLTPGALLWPALRLALRLKGVIR